MPEKNRPDLPGIVGSLLFIVLGALAVYHAREFTPLGSVFPRAIGIGMVVFAAVYIAVTLLRPAARAPAPGGSNWRRAGLIVVMVAWSVLLERVGFLATSVAAYAAIMVIANYDRWTPRRAVGYVAAGAVVLGAFYAVFSLALQVPLPPGILL